jgi:hypothetical protein
MPKAGKASMCQLLLLWSCPRGGALRNSHGAAAVEFIYPVPGRDQYGMMGTLAPGIYLLVGSKEGLQSVDSNSKYKRRGIFLSAVIAICA